MAIDAQETRLLLALPEKSVEVLGEVERQWVGHIPLVEKECLSTFTRSSSGILGFPAPACLSVSSKLWLAMLVGTDSSSGREAGG